MDKGTRKRTSTQPRTPKETPLARTSPSKLTLAPSVAYDNNERHVINVSNDRHGTVQFTFSGPLQWWIFWMILLLMLAAAGVLMNHMG